MLHVIASYNRQENPIGGILATQPGGVCRDEGYIPLGGLDKTLVVNDVLYISKYQTRCLTGRAKKLI